MKGPEMRLLCTLLLLSGCAARNFHSDHSNPTYHSGGDQILLPGVADKVLGNEPSPHIRPENDPGLALGGVLASGVLLALNNDYYQSSSIGGRLVCGTPMPGIEIPCNRVVVILKNSQGQEVNRVTSEDGQFFFQVSRLKDYEIAVDSPRYRLAKEVKNLNRGDNVLLRLDPITN